MVGLERVSGGRRGTEVLDAEAWCKTSMRFTGDFAGEEELVGTTIFSVGLSRFLELGGFFDDPEESQLAKSALAFLFVEVELPLLYLAVMRSAHACTSPLHWMSASSTMAVSGWGTVSTLRTIATSVSVSMGQGKKFGSTERSSAILYLVLKILLPSPDMPIYKAKR